jgi:hypothetical protein
VKKYILLLIVPILSFGQELTYVPDDSFEEYIEMYFPEANNGIINDNYVLTNGLDRSNFMTGLNGLFLTPSYVNGPIFDLTGIEDISGLTLSLVIEQQPLTTIDLSGLNYSNDSYPIGIGNCPLLEEIILPSDTVLGIGIADNPSLNNIIFPSDIFFTNSNNYFKFNAPHILITNNANLCELQIKGSAYNSVPPGATLITISNVTQCDFSEFINSYNTILNIAAQQVNLIGPNLYNWTEVSVVNIDDNVTCVQVQNPSYCEVSNNWPSNSVNYSINCYNPTDCESLTEMIEMSITNKQLIKKIDILGRGTNQKGFNIEIYDDGSVEKKYVIE